MDYLGVKDFCSQCKYCNKDGICVNQESSFHKVKVLKSGILCAPCFERLELQMEDEKIHNLKILPEYFEAVISGDKTFEIRKNDRNFKIGDTLNLEEWDGNNYTGRNQTRRISYILEDNRYLLNGYVALAFDMH